MEPFLISERHLIDLAATRQGRISLAGFNYQAAYAVARLASMLVRRPVLDLADVPTKLRYDWGEDLDERRDDNTVVFTQCKRIDNIGQPASLCTVLVSFAAKWLLVPAEFRDFVSFRLVSTDVRFRNGGLLIDADLNAKAHVKHFLANLSSVPGIKTDRAIWQSEADAFGHEKLFDVLWAKTEAVTVSGGILTNDPAGSLLPAERSALSLLLVHDRIASKKQSAALDRLRRVVHDNLIEFEPGNEVVVERLTFSPRHRTASDVSLALAACRDDSGRGLPFEVVDRTFLSIQRQAPRQQFVARQPDWADVVHGADVAVKFVERDMTLSLRDSIVRELIEPIERGTNRRLQMLFVTGAPGSGKTTLARRVASILVEDGRVVVADAGLDIRDPVETAETYVRELQVIATAGRPILLLIDDPLYAKSPWLDLLHKLARPGLGVAVLAPCPQLLFDRHVGAIAFGSKHQVQIGRPTDRERKEMASLYSRDSKTLQTADEFLVVAMEAAAGFPFDEIIRRLWRTLNDGQPIVESDIQGLETLGWRIGAFMIVSFFHRAYSTCPEPLLRAALELTGGKTPGPGIANALAQLHDEHGWKLFQLSDVKNPRKAYLGVQISTAHQRIALRAWDLRPLRWCDLGGWIIKASINAPHTLRRSGALAARLAASEDVVDKNFAGQLVAVALQEASAGNVQTRYVCELATTLQTNGQLQEAAKLSPLFYRLAVPSLDGWLAALQLYFLSGENIATQNFPSTLDLSGIVKSADFSLVPTSATTFFLRSPGHVTADIETRLLDAFDGKLSWRLDPYLMAWIISNASGEAITIRGEEIINWLDAHSEDVRVRIAYFSRLSKQHLDEAHLERLVTGMSAWLKEHPEDATMRAIYLARLSKQKLNEVRLQQVIVEIEAWLEEHPENTSMRIAYLALLAKQPLGHFYLTRVLNDTEKWLRNHPEAVHVRAAYLGRLAKQKLDAADLKRIASDTRAWLANHPEDNQVRSAYLVMLSKQMELDDVHLRVALMETQTWLDDHPNDAYTRSILDLVQRSTRQDSLPPTAEGASPEHSTAPVPVAPDKVRSPLEERVLLAIDTVAQRAWEQTVNANSDEDRFGLAKQEAIRLIKGLSPYVRRQVAHQFTSGKWKALLDRAPEDYHYGHNEPS